MQTVLSLSDVSIYPAPMAFMLQDFTQVQASVFQVASAPGKTVVYTGCALLILGVFAMLYIRERRVWVWLAPSSDVAGHATGTQASMALSTNRKTMDGDHEFAHLTEKLIGAKPDMKSDQKTNVNATEKAE
jgi:cytochrome c biogenesis protein